MYCWTIDTKEKKRSNPEFPSENKLNQTQVTSAPVSEQFKHLPQQTHH